MLRYRLLCCTALVLVGCRSQAVSPRVDGVFGEWAGAVPAATDAAGDNSNLSDITRVFVTSRGTMLYVRFDINAELNLQSGASNSEIPLLHIERSNGTRLTIDSRQRRSYLNGNQNSIVSWAALKLITAPTYAADEFELRADLAAIGAQIGEPLSIWFTGSDSLSAPISHTLSASPEPVSRWSFARMRQTSFRLASLNTLQTGLFDASQQAPLSRLIDAVDAEIYCFQEEYDSNGANIASLLTQIDPTDDGSPWQAHKHSDCVVATKGSLIPIPSLNSKYVAAAIDLGMERRVVVFSIHPKCCGYIGSSEDVQRITETQAMLTTINNLRSGSLGASLAPFADAPVIVAGDWNLVGSRTPLDLLTNPQGPALREWMLPHLIGRDVFTWIGNSTGAGSFQPGRLDLLTYSPESLATRNGFLLDSRVLNSNELAMLGLSQNDSAASDHLLLVADFALTSEFPVSCAGDADGDQTVTANDIVQIASQLGFVGSGPADADANGIIDVNDLTHAIFRIGKACDFEMEERLSGDTAGESTDG